VEEGCDRRRPEAWYSAWPFGVDGGGRTSAMVGMQCYHRCMYDGAGFERCVFIRQNQFLLRVLLTVFRDRPQSAKTAQ
jgi:hypothetical protein